jgi:hypothetical protein
VYNITLNEEFMANYSKQFLLDAYMSRFIKQPHITIETLCKLEENADALYEKVGKIEFRKYASLDADAIKEYQNEGTLAC